MKDINLQIKKAQQTPSCINSETETKTQYNQTVKGLRENLESSKKEVTHHVQGIPIRLSVDFSSKTLETRRKRNGICLKG